MVLLHTMRPHSAARMIVPFPNASTSEWFEELCGTKMPIKAPAAMRCPTTPARSAGHLHVSRHPFQLRCGASTSMISHLKSTLSLTISAAAACICGLHGGFSRASGYLSLSSSRSPATPIDRLLASRCMGRRCASSRGQAAYSAPRSALYTTDLSISLPKRSPAVPRAGPIPMFLVADRSTGRTEMGRIALVLARSAESHDQIYSDHDWCVCRDENTVIRCLTS
jgi:hypothetical protein